MIPGIAAAAYKAKMEKKNTGYAVPKPPKEGGQYFVCEKCPAGFNRRYNRDRHMKLVHGNRTLPELRPQYPATLKRKVAIIAGTPGDVLKINNLHLKRKNMDNDDSIEKKIRKEMQDMEGVAVEDVIPVAVEEKEEEVKSADSEEDTDEATSEEEEEVKKVEPKEDKKTEECKEENLNLIQIPMDKEVTVTVFITSK